jgi:hypothetical protein
MIFLRLLPRLTHPPHVSFGSCVCLLALLLLTSCSSANRVIAHATPTATAGPAPVTTRLAPPPQNCNINPPPQQQHLDSLGTNRDVQLVGSGPFWIYSSYYPSVLHLAQFGYQQWPITKIVVEVGPNYDQPVTLRLQNMETGALVWWSDGQTPPDTATQTLVLNPQTDTEDVSTVPRLPYAPHGSPTLGWKEWGIFPLFSVAGCYTLEVSWSSGSWQSSFAVGN